MLFSVLLYCHYASVGKGYVFPLGSVLKPEVSM